MLLNFSFTLRTVSFCFQGGFFWSGFLLLLFFEHFKGSVRVDSHTEVCHLIAFSSAHSSLLGKEWGFSGDGLWYQQLYIQLDLQQQFQPSRSLLAITGDSFPLSHTRTHARTHTLIAGLLLFTHERIKIAAFVGESWLFFPPLYEKKTLKNCFVCQEGLFL